MFFVNTYLQLTRATVLRVYKEIESGYDEYRPELEKAIRYCKRTGATLIFSTMSRLSRNALLVAGLMMKRIRFIAADKPYADDLDHLEDAIDAERELRRIRRRTKEGLQAAKAKGVELGKYGKVLAGINREKADAFAKEKGPIIQALHDAGYSYESIARLWNKEGVSSYREGCFWHASTIYDVWKRSMTIHQGVPASNTIINYKTIV